jgi:prolyl oligopeptidase
LACTGLALLLVGPCCSEIANGSVSADGPVKTDQYAYLENKDDPRTREWVNDHTARTLRVLEHDRRYSNYLEVASTALSRSAVSREFGDTTFSHGFAYQLIADAEHPKEIFRRTRIEDFVAQRFHWDVLLDMEARDAEEGVEWKFVHAYVSPSGRRCLIKLSRGANTYDYRWREFDLAERQFPKDGFEVPQSYNSHAAWRDDDTLLVSTNFGVGTVNATNMPVTVREWHRGQPLQGAREIFHGEPDDVAVTLDETDAGVGELPGAVTWRLKIFRWAHDGSKSYFVVNTDGSVHAMSIPRESWPKLYRDNYIVKIDQQWAIGGKMWPAGSLLAVPASEIASTHPDVRLVMNPIQQGVIADWYPMSDGLLILGWQRGKSFLRRAIDSDAGWTLSEVRLPGAGTARYLASDVGSPLAYVTFQSFTVPSRTYLLSAGTLKPFGDQDSEDSGSPFVTQEREARSADGVGVPYFVVSRRGASPSKDTPTIVFGYGASSGAVTPTYDNVLIKLWLEKGGAFVVASVRGGSELGPEWHVTGVNRQHTYDDMYAVVEALLQQHMTSARRLAIEGMSDGGLLAGAMLTQHPDLFGAAVLKVAVLDEMRMDLLAGGVALAGPELGSPDIPFERSFLERTSPFQNLRHWDYFPQPLIMTSATDPAVSPAISRRFAAKIETLGMPFFFLETPSGGHEMADTPQDRARLAALQYVYLTQRLFDEAH